MGERKVVIVGAGQVGATFAFSLMISGLATSIVLVDLSPDRAEGHVMDLNHGLSFVKPSKIYAGDKEEIFNQVKNAAYDIIKRKGATYFSIGLALVRIVESILRDENSVLPVSTLVDSYHDISDVCLSIPVIVNDNGISRILKIGLDESEVKKLQASANVLSSLIRTVDI